LGLDEMKTNFLANVSHELRTPLSSIRAFSELLLSYDDESVRAEFLQIINSESERLTRLVNDVLDITKIESGHMDWRMSIFNLAALLSDSARTFSTLIEQQNLVFKQEIEENLPSVYGDRDRLQQVVGNLLGNAVKFAPQGTITLVARRQGSEVLISVADTGIGIAPEDQERIFAKFQQVGDTLTEKPRGTGLGLAICRDIVEHHEGQLWVESQLGMGSRFTFSLPLAAAAPPPQESVVGSPEPVLANARNW
jgi:signal transduction histidine kinase